MAGRNTFRTHQSIRVHAPGAAAADAAALNDGGTAAATGSRLRFRFFPPLAAGGGASAAAAAAAAAAAFRRSTLSGAWGVVRGSPEEPRRPLLSLAQESRGWAPPLSLGQLALRHRRVDRRCGGGGLAVPLRRLVGALAHLLQPADVEAVHVVQVRVVSPALLDGRVEAVLAVLREAGAAEREAGLDDADLPVPQDVVDRPLVLLDEDGARRVDDESPDLAAVHGAQQEPPLQVRSRK
eukprot:gene1394-biopygen3488